MPRPACLLPALFCLALGIPPAHAVVGGAGVDPPGADSPWAGVGAVDTGKGHYTGALIGPRHVLTAAHVVKGRPAEDIVFHLNLAEGRSLPLCARAVHVHPGFRGVKPNAGGVWFDDLAVVELAEPAPAGVPVYGLYVEFLLIKSMIAFVGYGRAGDGKRGAHLPGDRHTRRVGYNRIDALVRDSGEERPKAFLFDFDGPDYSSNVFKPDQPINASLGPDMEATFAGGDSGAPVFVFDQGAWKIAGVAAFVLGREGGKGLFGSLGGGMLVPAYLDWIRSVISGDGETDARHAAGH